MWHYSSIGKFWSRENSFLIHVLWVPPCKQVSENASAEYLVCSVEELYWCNLLIVETQCAS